MSGSWLSFFLGSAFTLALTYAYQRQKKKVTKKRLKEDSKFKKYQTVPTRRLLSPKSTAKLTKEGTLIPPVVVNDDDGNGNSNSFLSQIVMELWDKINHGVSDMLESTIQETLDTLPGGIKFTKFDLGKTPLTIENIVVSPRKHGKIKMGLDLFWNGESNIKLRVTKGGINLGIKNIKFAGRLQLLLYPLIDKIPMVAAVQYAFINPPFLDFNFTGITEMVDVGGLHNTIIGIVRGILNGMVVLPRRMNAILDYGSDLLSIYQKPLGIVRLKVIEGRGFKIENEGNYFQEDVPDCYCVVKFGINEPWRTSVIKDNCTPVWNETRDFVLSDHEQFVEIIVMDKDSGTFDSDDFLGKARFCIGDLLASSEHRLEIQLNGDDEDETPNGCVVTLSCQLFDLTPNPDSYTAEAFKGEGLNCGHMAVLISGAYNVPEKYRKLGTSMKVTCGEKMLATGVVAEYPGIDAENPLFNSIFDFPITSEFVKTAEVIKFELLHGTNVIGLTTVTQKSVIELASNTLVEKRDIGKEGISFDFSVSMLGMELVSDKAKALSNYAAAKIKNVDCGRLQITAVSGHGFKVLKSFMKKDIPDIYLVFKHPTGGEDWKTSTHMDCVDPVWNEQREYEVPKFSDWLHIEVWDEETKGKDQLLGKVRVRFRTLVRNGFRPTELEVINENGKGTKAFITLKCKELATTSFNTRCSLGENIPVIKDDDADKSVTKDDKPQLVDNDSPTKATTVSSKNEDDYVNVKKSEGSPPALRKAEPLKSKPPPQDKTKGKDRSICPPIPDDGSIINIRLTTVRGHGFKVVKKFLSKDIPDVYCSIKVNMANDTWITKTIKNDVTPTWNEAKDFQKVNISDKVQLKAYNENKKSNDSYIGWVDVTIEELLEACGDDVEFELRDPKGQKGIGSFVTLKCVKK